MYASETIQNCKNPTGHKRQVYRHFKVLKSKMTFVRGMMVPFRRIDPKNMRGSKCLQILYLLGVNTSTVHRHPH